MEALLLLMQKLLCCFEAPLGSNRCRLRFRRGWSFGACGSSFLGTTLRSWCVLAVNQ